MPASGAKKRQLLRGSVHGSLRDFKHGARLFKLSAGDSAAGNQSGPPFIFRFGLPVLRARLLKLCCSRTDFLRAVAIAAFDQLRPRTRQTRLSRLQIIAERLLVDDCQDGPFFNALAFFEIHPGNATRLFKGEIHLPDIDIAIIFSRRILPGPQSEARCKNRSQSDCNCDHRNDDYAFWHV